ncbi:MAG: YhbY family RNA-binding protein [Candidatus Woesearchaeota archaeon]
MTISQKLGVTVQIGKKGITEEALKEITRQLQKRKTVKIKLLKSSLGRETRQAMKDRIVQSTGSLMTADVGNILVIAKKEKQIKRPEHNDKER